MLELVVLYLVGRLAILLDAAGRFSFDADMGLELISSIVRSNRSDDPSGLPAQEP